MESGRRVVCVGTRAGTHGLDDDTHALLGRSAALAEYVRRGVDVVPCGVALSGSNAESTTNKFKGTNSSPAPGFTAAGPVGTAFSGDGKKYFMTPMAIWEGFEGTNFAYSAWVKADAVGHGRILSSKSVHTEEKGFELTMQNAINKVMMGGPTNKQKIVEVPNSRRITSI